MKTGWLRYEVRTVGGEFLHVYHAGDRDLATAYAASVGGVVVDLWGGV